MGVDCDGGVAVLINPNSGGNRRRHFGQLHAELSEQAEMNVFSVTDLQQMDVAIAKCRQSGVEILVLQGGDGTVQMALTVLFRHTTTPDYSPHLLLISAGTTNMTHNDVGCRLPLTVAVREASRYLRGQSHVLRSIERHVLRVTFTESKPVVCGMFLGAGMIYSGILYCRQNIHTRGVRGSIGPGLAMVRFIREWIAGRVVDDMQFSYRSADTPDIQLRSSLALVTTLRSLILGVKPFWSVSRLPIKGTVIEKKQSVAPIDVMRLLCGKEPNKNCKSFHNICCEKADVEIQGGFTIDGELYGNEQISQKLKLEAAGPVRFLY